MTDNGNPIERLTPAAARAHARRFAFAGGAVLVAAALLILLFHAYPPNRPVEYERDLDHFYYGSIGSDITGGLPVKVLKVLPKMFPEYLPADADEKDYSAFGFLKQPDHELPIGFSIRRQFIDLAGLNCAVCHTGKVRGRPGAEVQIIPGMPANTVDILGFFRFLFRTAADDRFTSANVIAAMDEMGLVKPLDRVIYRLVVPEMREGLLEQKQKLKPFLRESYPPWGPGRVNTFDPFKFDQFASYYAAHDRKPQEIYGIADLPSIWNQSRREGLWLHWDGNNSSARERNFSAAIAAGAEPHNVDTESLYRIDRWLDSLSAPDYPYEIDRLLARKGAPIFEKHCATCHSYDGERTGTVIPIEEIGTDAHRLNSYSGFLKRAQKAYTEGYSWQFENFRTTDGYAARPLDGIWARAPYLHNGSVPTMRDLLRPEDERPAVFTRGSDVYDQHEMGFEHRELTGRYETGYVGPDGDPYTDGAFVLDTKRPGNGNEGHSGPRYGTTLSNEEKNALIEYLKTR